MRTNLKRKPIHTHEGGTAAHINAEQQLRRSVLACLLFEDEAYEDGKTIADRIEEFASKVPAEKVHALAVEARKQYNLRHVPLLLLTVRPNAQAIYDTISRADELSELLSIYWRNGKRTIPAQMKRGLAKAFTKFNEYSLAKYNRDSAIKLRDVLFMTHAKPKDKEQADLWKRLVDNQLAIPDTWEVALSAGKNKKDTWESMIRDGTLGYLALLRNLRNMIEAKVDDKIISDAIVARENGAEKVLPFRFIAAARHAPKFEPYLDQAMQKAITDLPKLSGKTVVLVDVSGSMNEKLSGKSELTRMDAACALASIVTSDSLRVYSFSNNLVEVPPRRGMAGVDAVRNSQSHGGTNLAGALMKVNSENKYDRIIVITDEQSHDDIVGPIPGSKGYLINVASAKNGVGYGAWTHIDGFSENVVRYIYESEK